MAICTTLIKMTRTDGNIIARTLVCCTHGFTSRCEYILYRGLYRTAYVRVSRSTVTDTELQIGQFLLPKHKHNATDEEVAARYLRAHKEELSEDHVRPAVPAHHFKMANCSLVVVPNGLLRQQKERRGWRSLLSRIWYCEYLSLIF
jgi:hypothetical protein